MICRKPPRISVEGLRSHRSSEASGWVVEEVRLGSDSFVFPSLSSFLIAMAFSCAHIHMLESEPMNAETITAWATVITAIFVLAVPLYVEYSKRRQNASQAHFKDIKRYVLEHLNNLVVNYYLRVLESKSGMLEVSSELVCTSDNTPSSQSLSWKPILRVRDATPSLGTTIGDTIAFQEWDKTFDHLYEDMKRHHFQTLALDWEQMEAKFYRLSQACLTKTQHIQNELMNKLGLPGLLLVSKTPS